MKSLLTSFLVIAMVMMSSFAQPGTIDEVIGELKRIGFDRALTVRALMHVMAIPIEKAEQRVNRHPAWTEETKS